MDQGELEYMKNLFESLLLIKNDLYQASIDPCNRQELIKKAIDELDTALGLPKGYMIKKEDSCQKFM